MKLITIILFISIPFFSPIMEEEKIEWTEEYQLQWSDFKATTASGNDFVASTSSGIGFSYSYRETNGKRDVKVDVVCNFYPQKSWYSKKDASDYILKHEQTHFDISELHKRIFKKRIDETHFSEDMKKELEALFHKTENDRVEMQHKFDDESDHSKNKEKELEWEAFVAQQLEVYEHWN